MSERIVPLIRQSKMFPSSTQTEHSTVTFQTYLPDKIQSDSGSNAFDPTTTVYNNLEASVANFFCYS